MKHWRKENINAENKTFKSHTTFLTYSLRYLINYKHGVFNLKILNSWSNRSTALFTHSIPTTLYHVYLSSWKNHLIYLHIINPDCYFYFIFKSIVECLERVEIKVQQIYASVTCRMLLC